MDQKELKKKRDMAKIQIGLTLSASQLAVLNKMMEAEDWSNRSGYIKYKIFGESEDYQFKKMLKSGSEKDIQNVLVSLISDMNRQIDYVNFRFDSELFDFKNKVGEIDEAKAKKWIAYLEEWKTALQQKTDEIFFDCQTILRAIKLNIERKEYKDVRNVPDYVIEKASKDWNDTTSPLVREGARRVMEQFYKEHPELAPSVPEENKKKKDK